MLNNHGSDTVYINDVIGSCHCIEALLPSDCILPEKNMPIKVKFREDSVLGDFKRSVHIYYRDFNNPTVFSLSGTIVK